MAVYRLDQVASPTMLRHFVVTHLGAGRYLRYAISGLNSAPNDFHRVEYIDLCLLDRWLHTDNDTITYNGTWLSSGSAQGLSGNYKRSTAAGPYVERTTGAGCTRVGAYASGGATAIGFALVSIDGDATRATLLPTAQALVDGGLMDAAALIGGGGTLNATDRIWDAFPQAVNFLQVFADDLTAGVHTFRITNTGYKRAAAGSTWTTFTALMEGGPYDTSVARWDFSRTLVLAGVASAVNPTIEISYLFQPSGTSQGEWCGHSGSLKMAALPAWTVDGVSTSLSQRTLARGNAITMSESLGIRHSEKGTTDQGTLALSFSFDCRAGLTIAHTLVWAVSGTATGYPGMMMAEKATFDRFRGLTTSVVQLDTNDDSANANTREQAAYCWDFDGNVGMLLAIPDLALTVENWVKTTTRQLWWADVSANSGTWKKAYVQRFQASEAFVNGTTWQSAINYRTAWFAGGAQAALG